MSTRCNIVLRKGQTRIYLYRHCDGYLAETGAHLLETLRGFPSSTGFLLTLLHSEFNYQITTDLHGDIEHVYELVWTDDGTQLAHAQRPRDYPPVQEWAPIPTPYTWAELAAKVNEDRRDSNAQSALIRPGEPAPYEMLESTVST